MAAAEPGPIRGVVSPHIDYARGGPVYKAVWSAAEQAVQDADLAIIFGTDHSGGLREGHADPAELCDALRRPPDGDRHREPARRGAG